MAASATTKPTPMQTGSKLAETRRLKRIGKAVDEFLDQVSA